MLKNKILRIIVACGGFFAHIPTCFAVALLRCKRRSCPNGIKRKTVWTVRFLLAWRMRPELFPMFQQRKVFIPLRAPLFVRQMIRIWHVADKIIKQSLFRLVRKCAVGIAPFAIFFIERSVGFSAGYGIVKRHSAALTN